MKPTEFQLWMIRDERTGKMHKTRHLMTEATALQRHPEAVEVPNTHCPAWLDGPPQTESISRASQFQGQMSSTLLSDRPATVTPGDFRVGGIVRQDGAPDAGRPSGG